MNRLTLTKIHLYLSAFFVSFILLMAVSGTNYLLGNKGSIHKEMISTIVLGEKKLTKDDVINHLKKIDPKYSFEYIKESPNVFYTRPTTRTHYQFKKKDSRSYIIYKATPNFLASIIEVHKGHGPILVKFLQKILGFVLMLILVSGVWLALQLNRDRKMTLILIGSGFSLLASMILFL